VNFQERLLHVIPGGAHTYSRGFDQFPSNAPQILVSGKGVDVVDTSGNHFLDFGMALRSVGIGYAEDEINNAAITEILKGNGLTKASMTELLAAERLVGLIDSADMVKFTKNGSTATTAAVKLSRAYTGRVKIARCIEQPFLSYDDWFIGSTVITKGIPDEISQNTLTFEYNNLESFKNLVEAYPNEIACVILEPATVEHPKGNFLHKIKELCHENGIVFVLDEMITGFRWDIKGAQSYYNIEADLCTFGKAMANGFSVAAVAGKREIMEQGAISKLNEERLFLLSTTHGAEMSGLGAFLATIDFMEEHSVTEHYWTFGQKLMDLFNTTVQQAGMSSFVQMKGIPCSPYFETKSAEGKNSLPFRTLFLQEMIKHGVLIPWVALAYRHDESTLTKLKEALEATLVVYKKALEDGWEVYLDGDVIKPVFRKFN